MTWKLTDSTGRVVSRTNALGEYESALVSSPEIQEWIAAGNIPLPADPQQQPSAQEQINSLEAQQLLPRVTREFMLTSFEAQAAAKGLTIAQLTTPTDPNYAPGFAKLYAFDQQIAALRSQIK